MADEKEFCPSCGLVESHGGLCVNCFNPTEAPARDHVSDAGKMVMPETPAQRAAHNADPAARHTYVPVPQCRPLDDHAMIPVSLLRELLEVCSPERQQRRWFIDDRHGVVYDTSWEDQAEQAAAQIREIVDK